MKKSIVKTITCMLLIIAILGAFAMPAMACNPNTQTMYVVNVDYAAYLWANANATNAFATVPKGAEVEVLSCPNAITYYVYYNGYYGYIKQCYLSADYSTGNNSNTGSTMYIYNVDYAAYLWADANATSPKAFVMLGEAVTVYYAANSKTYYCSYNGQTGYIKQEFLTSSRPYVDTDVKSYKTTTACLYFRQAPTDRATVLGTIPKGARVGFIMICSNNRAYAKVSYNGQIGYVKAAYIR